MSLYIAQVCLLLSSQMIFLWDNVLYLVPCTLIIQRYAIDFFLLKHTFIRVYSKIVFNHVFREIAKPFCYHFWYWHILQTWCWPFICLYLIECTRLNCVLVNDIITISYGLCVWAGRNLLPWIPCISLTHWGRVTHICVNKLTIIGSDNYLNQCWSTIDSKLRNKLQWNHRQIFIHFH